MHQSRQEREKVRRSACAASAIGRGIDAQHEFPTVVRSRPRLPQEMDLGKGPDVLDQAKSTRVDTEFYVRKGDCSDYQVTSTVGSPSSSAGKATLVKRGAPSLRYSASERWRAPRRIELKTGETCMFAEICLGRWQNSWDSANA